MSEQQQYDDVLEEHEARCLDVVERLWESEPCSTLLLDAADIQRPCFSLFPATPEPLNMPAATGINFQKLLEI